MLLSEQFNLSRHETDFDSIPPGLLIIVEPDDDLTEKEIFSLKQWISQGNTLVFFS